MSRVQLALNVNDLDEAIAFYRSSLRPSRPRSARATPTSPSQIRPSSSS